MDELLSNLFLTQSRSNSFKVNAINPFVTSNRHLNLNQIKQINTHALHDITHIGHHTKYKIITHKINTFIYLIFL